MSEGGVVDRTDKMDTPTDPLGAGDVTSGVPGTEADAVTTATPVVPPRHEQLIVGDELPTSLHVRLFGSRAYFRLWLAQVVSSLGDWIGFVAVVTLASRIGGSSPEAAIGLVMSARIVPGFFLSQVAGVLIDRWDRKRVMITCDIARGCVLASLPFLDTVWQLVLASLLLEIFTLLWSPAKEASVPNLVPADHLTTVNSLSLVAAYGTFPLASLAFSFLAKLAEWLGEFDALDFLQLNRESIAIYFDVLTFFASAVMITTLPLVRRPKAVKVDNGKRIDWAQAFHELKEGWHFIFINPTVRAVMVAIGTGLIGGGMMVPLGPVFSEEVLGAGPAGFGLLLTALGFGVGIGVTVLSALQRRLPKTKVFTGAIFGAGGCLLGAASLTSLGPTWVCVLGLGICAGGVYVLGFTILHESVEDDLRGRIFSTLYTLVRFCLLASFALGPFLAGALDELSADLFGADRRIDVGFSVFLPGVRLTLWLAGGTMVLAGMLTLVSIRGRVRSRSRADDDEPVATTGVSE